MRYQIGELVESLRKAGRSAIFRTIGYPGIPMFFGPNATNMQQRLFDEFGPYCPLSRVWRFLAYTSLDAARKAAARGTTPVPCLSLPNRRGRFLRTDELAKWMESVTAGTHNQLEAR